METDVEILSRCDLFGGDLLVVQEKIFITLGSQKFQFNRLLEEIDKLCQEGEMDNSIFAQIGYSSFRPKNFQYKDFLDRDEFGKVMSESDIVITHGGTGAIIGAVKRGKKVIAVPRMEKYGEHVDDHQIQIVRQFEDLKLICSCYEVENILEAIDEVKSTTYNEYKSNTQTIIDSIEKFIKES